MSLVNLFFLKEKKIHWYSARKATTLSSFLIVITRCAMTFIFQGTLLLFSESAGHRKWDRKLLVTWPREAIADFREVVISVFIDEIHHVCSAQGRYEQDNSCPANKFDTEVNDRVWTPEGSRLIGRKSLSTSFRTWHLQAHDLQHASNENSTLGSLVVAKETQVLFFVLFKSWFGGGSQMYCSVIMTQGFLFTKISGHSPQGWGEYQIYEYEYL